MDNSRTIIIVATAVAVAVVLAADRAAGAPQSQYTTKYDNIDIDQVLASKRLVNTYVQCLLDKKPCTPEGAELRSEYRTAVIRLFFFFFTPP